MAAKQYDLAGFLSFCEDSDLQTISNHYSRHLAERQSRQSDGQEGLLALARQSLAAFHFVGITEQLADSLDLFCLRYHLPPCESLPRLNESTAPLRKTDLSDTVLQRLTDLNRLDLQLYREACARLAEEQRDQLRACLLERQGSAPPPAVSAAPETPTLPRRAEDFGNRQIVIVTAEVIGMLSGTSSVGAGETVRLSIDIRSTIALNALTVGMQIFDENGATVFGTNSFLLGCPQPVAPDRRYRLTYQFPVHLGLGHYEVGVALHTGIDHHDCCFHWWDRAARFDVVDQGSQRFIGYVHLPVTPLWQAIDDSGTEDETSLWRRLSRGWRS